MTDSFDVLLRQYEDGKLSRRHLLGAMATLALPASTRAQSGSVRARSLHHVNVGVSDLDRSEDFYRTILGLPTRRYIVGDAYALDFPDGGLISLCPVADGNCSLTAGSAEAGTMDHFGVGIEDFDTERVAGELEAAGVETVRRAGSNVLVADPDGLVVQLSSPDETFEGTPPDRNC